MNETPYATPASELDVSDPVEVPEEVLKKIKNAAIAGTISIVMTVIFTLVSIYGTEIMGLNYWAFMDVGLMIIFTIGIHKKSRVCAVCKRSINPI